MNIDKEKLQQVMDEATASGEECGCQLAIFHRGKPVLSLVSGYTSAARTEKVTEQTIFPIFSCGKSVMATMVHRLAEQGVLHYDDRIADHWPEFGCNGKEGIRLWMVMSHRTGLHILPELDNADQLADWDFMCRKMAEAVPSVPPGTKCLYQGVTHAWLVGETVRRAAGKSMQALIREQIFQPLGIDDSFAFGTTPEQDRRCVKVDTTKVPDSWCAHRLSNPSFRHGFIPSANGCANAFSLAKYYSALVAETDGIRLLKEATLDRALKLCRHPDDPIPPQGTWAKFGLGYALLPGDDGTLGVRFGHGGALGSEGFADRRTGYAVAFTKNMDLPTHPLHPVRNRISAVLGLPERIW
ncbi:MAG: beta-lactamase family protein [Lentisphaeria bacterium]|nr:beta-lactamase family protein [Lentisphaeria bacterium]